MRDRDKWMGIACACLAILLYLNTLGHGYALDDYPTIYGNRLTMAGLHGIPTMLHTGYWYGLDGLSDWLYRPLSLVMFAIEWQVAPATPALGHLVNVLLYAVTAVVLFRFLRDLFDGYDVLVPFAIALLWIAHPIHTEVVANIKSRDELLSFLFSILTLWQCVKYVSAPSRKHLLLSGGYFFLALMSKESPITLLVIVPMTLFVFRRPDARTMLRAVAPIGVAAAVYLAIRSFVLTSQTGSSSAISLIDNSLMAAPDFMHRQATAFYIGAMYLRLLVFPYPMSSDYSFRQVPVVGFDNPVAIGSLLVYGAMLVYGVVRLRKRDPAAYGILFFLISISLVANVLFLTRSTMADRFLYAPSLGFSIVFVFLLARVLRLDVKSVSANRPWSVSLVFAGVVWLTLVGSIALTWARNPDWKNDTTLFSADSRHSPNSARIHFLYGNHMLQELKTGKVEPSRQDEYYNIALAEFRRAIALYPAYVEPHMLIGDAFTYRKDYAAAANWYTEIVTRNPRFEAGYIYLASTYASMGDNAKAIAAFQKALAIDPNDAGANYLLGTAYRAQGDSAAAKQYLEKAHALDPRMKP